MGQSMRVKGKRRLGDKAVRYELDRSLTGQAHERYDRLSSVSGDRPPDVLAQRLLALPSVESVHVFSNIVTVTTATAVDDEVEVALDDIIEKLFIHYLPGIEPTPIPTEVPAE